MCPALAAPAVGIDVAYCPCVATMSFLFVDQAGSTVQLEALGDAGASPIRDELFQILRAAVDDHKGTVVDHTGDGVMASFTGATDALGCAVDIQREVHRHWASRAAEHAVRVRIGLHTGETVVNAEGREFGMAVVIAARLCAAARSGQVLISDITQALTAGAEAARFRRLEPLALKGVADPVGVAEVEWDPPNVQDGWWPLPAALAASAQFGFVGRSPELEALRVAWARACGGAATAVLVAGEPGIGKTRLAAEFAAEVRATGARILFGGCDDELGVPFQPFVEALGEFVAGGRSANLRIELGRYAGDLVRLLPDLPEFVPGLPDPLRSAPEVERWRLFDAVVEWLAAAASVEPVLLVLDDLHWASKPTLLMLAHLLRNAGESRLLVLASYRDTDLGRGHPLAGMLADLRRVSTADRLALGGLDLVDVTSLVQSAADQGTTDGSSALAASIHTETEGNAFFVGEVVRHLVETGGFGTPTAPIGVPEGVREVIGHRLTRLSEAANSALTLGAVIGRDFDLELLERTTDLTDDALLSGLDEAVRARLLEEASAGRYRFAHALVRSTLYEELRPTRRARLHRSVVAAFEEIGGDHGVELAHHSAQAAAGGDPAKAISYSRAAGDHALIQLAPDEAAIYYGRALDMLDDSSVPDPELRCDLTISLGEAQRRASDPAHRETLFAAADQARALGDGDRLAMAALANGRPWGWSSTGDVDETKVSNLRSALAALSPDDSPARAALLGHLACELVFAEDRELSESLSADALAIARRVHDDPTLAQVLQLRTMATFRTSTPAARRVLADEQAVVAARVGDPRLSLLALMNVATAAIEHVDGADSLDALARARRIADDLAEPSASGFVLVWESALATFTGDLASGERLALEAFDIATQSGDPDAELVLGVQLYNVRLLQGRLDELEPLLKSVAERGLTPTAGHGMLAAVYAESGRFDEARVALSAAADHGFDGLDRDVTWVAVAANMAQACARLKDSAVAELLVPWLTPRRDWVIAGGPTLWGVGSHYLGLLAAARGRLDEAHAEFAVAAEAHERIGARPWLARTQVAWATVLHDRHASGDDAASRDLAAAAQSVAHELGLAGTEREATARLAR